MITLRAAFIAVTVVVFILRILFDAFIMQRRLRMRFSRKLFSVSLLSNTLALGIVSIISIPLIENSWVIFLVQILFLMAIEAPLYQVFYRKRSWYDLSVTLLISRFLFSIIAAGVRIIAILTLQGSLQELLQ